MTAFDLRSAAREGSSPNGSPNGSANGATHASAAQGGTSPASSPTSGSFTQGVRPFGDRRMAPRASVPGTTAARHRLADIIGTHPRIETARALAREAAGNARPVLVVGEAGTGRSLLAAVIHAESGRPGRLVTLQCTAPDADAGECLRIAEGGTVFLDGIGDLGPGARASLLRTLRGRDREATRELAAPAGVRLIASTASTPDDMLVPSLHSGLETLVVELPPLREHLSDVPALACHFLQQAAVEVGRPGLCFAPAVLDVLSRYPWPGNVRELRAQVRGLASLSVGTCITFGQLPPALLVASR